MTIPCGFKMVVSQYCGNSFAFSAYRPLTGLKIKHEQVINKARKKCFCRMTQTLPLDFSVVNGKGERGTGVRRLREKEID